MVKCLEGYVVKFYYQSKPVKALFLEKHAAEQHAIKWHGTISELYSDVEDTCQESRVLPRSSTIGEIDC
jgi:hypothetical protein